MTQISSADLAKLVEGMKQWVISAGEDEPVLLKRRL